MSELNLRLHKKQGQAFLSPATEILYGGAAGGGKSHLFRVCAIAWCMAIPGLQVYLFRRTFPDLWKNHMTGPGGFPELIAPLKRDGLARVNENKKQIQFSNGSTVHLCHCQYEKDVFDYQGADIHVLIIDELTQWLSSMYRYLRSRVRLGALPIPPAYAKQFPRVLTGANPGGVGHNWVKAGWIDIAQPLELTKMPNAEGGMKRQFIPAHLEDNPTLIQNDPEYEARLDGLGNPALVRAMRLGDWNIVAGGAFDDVWSSKIILPRFKPPVSWKVDRSFDWGSASPFSVLWFAESDGTQIKLPDGRDFAPPRGTLVVAHEWYGGHKTEPNKGLQMSARDVGKGIIEREKQLVQDGWLLSAPRPGPADNQIDAVSNPGTPTLADEMVSAGVRWTKSDKAPGTRSIGLELIRTRMREAGKDIPEAPALYIMDHCRGAISRWPVLPRDPKDPDDVDSKAEDHDYDALRYRVLATKPIKSSFTPLRM